MVSGRRAVGILLGAALCACSSNGPPGSFASGDGTDREPIVGGATDSTSKFVFGILINNMALCSGSLIAPNLILTARHCVAPINGSEESVNCASDTFGPNYAASGFVVTWDTNLTDGTPSNQLIGATEVRTNDNAVFCGNDIALLLLESNVPATTTPTVEPRVASMPMTNEGFSAVGYGLNSPNDEQGTSAGIRRGIGNLEVGCVGADECAGTRATDTEWAANSPICSGDSGGPAFDAQGRVIGIASRSDQTCALGLYSAVGSWKDLIVKAGQDAADQGGYDPPGWVTGVPTMGSGGTSSGGASMGGSSGSAGKAGSSGTGGSSAGAGGTTAAGGSSNAGTGGTSATGGSGGSGNTGAAGRGMGKAGSSGSSGTAGSGSPPDAGAPDSSAPTSAGLGDECTSGCVAPYVCYTTTGKPPGTCVPPCSVTTKCPADYRCSIELGACTPIPDSPDTHDSGDSEDSDDDSPKSDSGCGCRVTPVSDTTGGAWHALGALALATAAARRRRRSSRA